MCDAFLLHAKITLFMKLANAQEKFMRIKHAYNTLLNSESQFKYDFSNGNSNYSRTSTERKRYKTTQEEEFYGFGTNLGF